MKITLAKTVDIHLHPTTSSNIAQVHARFNFNLERISVLKKEQVIDQSSCKDGIVSVTVTNFDNNNEVKDVNYYLTNLGLSILLEIEKELKNEIGNLSNLANPC